LGLSSYGAKRFAEALDGLGRTVEAIPEFQAAAEIAPREPNLGLGYLYWKQHQFDEARTLQRSCASTPSMPKHLPISVTSS
jgi:Flp pilus assembly protein TadD